MSMLGQPYVEAVKGFEGFNPRPYWDYRQWTSGFGTRARPGETIDRATAEQRLNSELGSAWSQVHAFAPEAPDGVKAALTSLTFNSGDKWMRSGLGRSVQAGDYNDAKSRFLQYTKAGGVDLPGLVNRRTQEATWFDKIPDVAPQTGVEKWAAPGLMQKSAPPDVAKAGDQTMGERPQQLGLLDDLAWRLNAPLTQQGLGLFLAAAQGRDLNAGMNAGASRAAAYQDQWLKSQAAQRADLQRRYYDELMSSGSLKGMAPQAVALAKAAGPEAGMSILAGQIPKPRDPLLEDLTRAQINQLNSKDDTATPAGRARYAQQFGLTPGTPKYESYVLTGKMGRDEPLSATDRKAIMTAEDELPAIESTIKSLDRALELNDKTFTGFGAGARGWVGSSFPDWMVPDVVADSKTAEAQREFDQLTKGEAIKSMSATLKGATTDREMGQFVEILANPSTPPAVRNRTLTRMRQLAGRQMEIAKSRINSLRGGDYYKPGYEPTKVSETPQSSGGPNIGTVEDGYRFKGGNPADPNAWEKVQ